MRGPNPVLMHYYGNEELYQQKLAAEAVQDMTRLASIAAQTGADMAKKAGIVGSVAASPLTRKVLGAGAVLGGGILAAKGISTVHRAMSSEPRPRTFGPGRFGFNPAFGVNEYGQPQAGTPLV